MTSAGEPPPPPSNPKSLDARQSTAMRVGWILLGLLILGLVAGGAAILSGRSVGADNPGAGAGTRPDLVGGGGVVPGNSAAPTPVVPDPPAGTAFSVAGVGNKRTLTCNAGIASVSGVDNTVVLTGRCTRVVVSGVNNTVTIDEADAIDVSGMNNNVVFHSGSPELNKSGFDNTLQQG